MRLQDKVLLTTATAWDCQAPFPFARLYEACPTRMSATGLFSFTTARSTSLWTYLDGCPSLIRQVLGLAACHAEHR